MTPLIAVVGVRCLRDPQSLCAEDEYVHANACYKLLSAQLETREAARSMCEADGANLLHITSQVLHLNLASILQELALPLLFLLSKMIDVCFFYSRASRSSLIYKGPCRDLYHVDFFGLSIR